MPTLIAVLGLVLATHSSTATPRPTQPRLQTPVTAGAYWCPMHPNIRGEKGDICRICHMALVPAPPPDYEPYDIDIATRPQAPRPGRTTEVRLTIRDPRTHALVKDFETVHERILHLFIVSQDLEYFAHVHPQLQRNGSFAQVTVLPRPGAYRLIADFVPLGRPPQLVQESLVTAGYAGSLIPNVRIAPDITDKTVEGVRVKLSMPPPVGGREQLLTFEFADATTGAPLADLEPYLGAVGHLLLVSTDLETAVHSHPVADMSEAVGPTVVFQALFPRPGTYRFWVQFQRRGHVLVAPFTVEARPRDPISER